MNNAPTPHREIVTYKVSSSLEERLYATTDANHNVTSIDDVFGAVKERFVYDPYRNSTVLTSAWATTSDGYSWNVRSQGQREDATSNTIDSRNRVYGLGVGRWLQADNIGGYVDGANRYQFVKSNPVGLVDPTGLLGNWPSDYPYIAGRGTFNAILTWNDDFSSSMTIHFRPTPVVITKCLCTEIRFRQWVHQVSLGTWGYWHTSDTRDPRFGGWYSEPGDHPWLSTDPPGSDALMTDSPGANSASEFDYFTQVFLTYAVCAKGVEQGKAYGKLTWNHEINFKTNQAHRGIPGGAPADVWGNRTNHNLTVQVHGLPG